MMCKLFYYFCRKKMSDNENDEVRDPETRKRRHDDYNIEENEEYVIKKGHFSSLLLLSFLLFFSLFCF